jgi:hypothetical protein
MTLVDGMFVGVVEVSNIIDMTVVHMHLGKTSKHGTFNLLKYSNVDRSNS